ncbi:MAG: 16S rRNA (cytidine(1402)-2'-O)-methyltransferase [Deltaproteobacteria bacterium]|nr:16S rRNA (cytidine(1402)-2'-O)-methyltransferase [Deltaproteobacteria bacterium]
MPLTLPIDHAPEPTSGAGTLFVVATPIGHLEDITLRAIRTLREADLIAAEDTRHTRKLLTRHEIATPLISFFDHNKEKRTPQLLKKLLSGASIALVSDAGTPGVSDPGYHLITRALSRSIPVVPVPGPSAAIAALSVSGLPSDSFVFLGFVPRKPGKRRAFLEALQFEPRTLIFYESPRRLAGLIKTMRDVFGDRQAVLARELTKIHEDVLRKNLSGIGRYLRTDDPLKGECTLLVAGFQYQKDVDPEAVQSYVKWLRHRGLSPSESAKRAARELGVSRNLAYQQALKLEKKQGAQDTPSGGIAQD